MTGIDITALDYDALCDLRDEVNQRILTLKRLLGCASKTPSDSLKRPKLPLRSEGSRGIRWNAGSGWRGKSASGSIRLIKTAT